MQCNFKKIASSLTGMAILSSIVVGGAIPANAAPTTEPAAVTTAAASTNAILPDVKTQEAQIKEFEKLLNDFRAEYGLDPLKFNGWAAQEAQDWSKKMGKAGRLEHAGRADFFQPLEGTYRHRSENIASSGSTSVLSMFNQWKNSQAHRAAMLSEEATSFGVGFAYPTSDPKNQKMYGTTVFHAGHNAYVPETYASATSYFANANALSTSTANLINVTPAAPTFSKGKVTIPSTPGVRYYYPAKDRFLSAGVHNTYDQYTYITAVPLAGYHIKSATVNFWKYTNFESGDKFSIDLVKPQIFDSPTDSYRGYNLLPNMYVDYYVNGVLTEPDFYEVKDNRTVSITGKIKPALAGDFVLNDNEPLVHTFGAKSVTGKAVTFNPQNLEYTVPSVANISYVVNGAVKAPGTHKSKMGETLDIKAVPAAGYAIKNAQNFNVVYTFPGNASVISVTPTTPHFNNNGTAYTIPSNTGVTFRANGEVKAAGTHRVKADDVVNITAHANAGYRIVGTSSWSHHYVVEATAPAPTFNIANNTYVIPSSPAVDYYVNGSYAAPGEYIGASGLIHVTAMVKPGYAVSGNTAWSANFEDKKISVIPSQPSYDQFNGTITIPTHKGVQYFVDGSLKNAGTYPIKDGTTTISARATAGYVLAGNIEWSFTHKTPPAVINVTPTAPVFNADTYMVPTTKGVQYYVNGVLKNAGSHSLPTGVTTVVARPLSGYKIVGTASWSHTRQAPVANVKVATKAPKFSLTDGTYTIPEVKGLVYKVNGTVKSAGTHKATLGANATITAEAATGYSISSGDTKWVKVFPAQACKAPVFKDAKPGQSYWQPINWLYCEGITMGYANGTYGTSKQITRGEAAAFLYRIAGNGYVSKGTDFKDVPKGAAHHAAIGWMRDKGFSTGYVDGTFRSGRPVTRGELASFIYRVSEEKYSAPSNSPFKDMTSKSAHYTAIAWLNAEGASSGYTDGTYRPGRNVTRGETAKLLYVLR